MPLAQKQENAPTITLKSAELSKNGPACLEKRFKAVVLPAKFLTKTAPRALHERCRLASH